MQSQNLPSVAGKLNSGIDNMMGGFSGVCAAPANEYPDADWPAVSALPGEGGAEKFS